MEKSIAVFKGKEIRRTLHNNEWWFSIVDVVEALTGGERPRRYWNDLNKKLSTEGYDELSDKIGQLKLQSTDGKYYETDCANTETMFRIIQPIPSPKAEPFKRWLAKVGYERVQEIEDPELAKGVYKLYVPCYATSRSTSGCLAAMRRSVRAAPEGDRRPCSQSRRVRGETPRSAANFSWDRPVFARASATSVRSAGMISSFSTVPSLRVTSRRSEPSGCGMNCVFRAHSARPLLSIVSRKRRMDSLALLMLKHLLDPFEPCARDVVGKQRVSQFCERRQFNELPEHDQIYGNAVYEVKKEVMPYDASSLRSPPFFKRESNRNAPPFGKGR